MEYIIFYVIGFILILYAITMLHIGELPDFKYDGKLVTILSQHHYLLVIKFIFAWTQIIFYAYGLYKILKDNVGNIINTSIIIFFMVIVNTVEIKYVNGNKRNYGLEYLFDILLTVIIMLYFYFNL